MAQDKFAEIDQLIIEQIRSGKKTFTAIMEPRLRSEAEPFRGDAPTYRVLDRRLQALRKRGLISWSARTGWSVVEVSTANT